MILRRAETPHGPDFVCIGLMKAATGWLYDQLQFHPDFWMPPFKEFHYFDKTFPSDSMLDLHRAAHADLEALNARRRAKLARPLDARDIDFLDLVAAHRDRPPDLDRYGRLFAPKGGLLSGDITPAFSILDDEVIAPLAARFPVTRAILILRDPVERMWSQIGVTAYARTGGGEVLTSLDEVRKYMMLRQVQLRSRPSVIYQRWRRHFGNERLTTVFFDDIVERPEAARAEILGALGADPRHGGDVVPADFNRKTAHPRVAITDEARALLVEHLAEELRASAALFGGHAAAWARRHGIAA